MTDLPEPAAKRILIVDDEEGVVSLIQRLLSASGYDAVGAFDGDHGWRTFLRGSWDLVIVDRAMPGFNGEELAMKIKERSPNLPIIMITGIPSALKQRTLFAAILEKPFRIPKLLETVGRLLSPQEG